MNGQVPTHKGERQERFQTNKILIQHYYLLQIMIVQYL